MSDCSFTQRVPEYPLKCAYVVFEKEREREKQAREITLVIPIENIPFMSCLIIVSDFIDIFFSPPLAV